MGTRFRFRHKHDPGTDEGRIRCFEASNVVDFSNADQDICISTRIGGMAYMNNVTNNSARSRFELIEEGKLAYADYQLKDGILVIPHVEADVALRGKGTAGRLMEGILILAREQKLKVRPICSYAVHYMQRHPETHDLLV